MVDARGENTIVVVSGANACLDAGVESLLEGFAVGTDDVVLTGFEVPLAAVEASAQLARRRGARMVINPAPALPLSDHLVACAPDPDAECRGGDAPDRRTRCPDCGAPPLGPDRDLGGRDAWSRWGSGRAWRRGMAGPRIARPRARLDRRGRHLLRGLRSVPGEWPRCARERQAGQRGCSPVRHGRRRPDRHATHRPDRPRPRGTGDRGRGLVSPRPVSGPGADTGQDPTYSGSSSLALVTDQPPSMSSIWPVT